MGTFEESLARGALWAYATVFGAGVLTSLTPCVYPMIPITVSIFGAKKGGSRARAFLLATSYVMGIAAMYAVLGVLAGIGGWAAGSLLASPWFVVPLAAFFVVMATSMFGFWEIRLPDALQNRLALVGGRGFGGAFGMGLVGGILIAPCTGPVLAGILGYVATTRNIAFGASLLFVYALGIGVLFWVLATFAVALPKSGRWMETVKGVFGLMLLVAALYFLQNAFPALASYASPRWTFALGNALLVLLGLALGAAHLSYHGASAARVIRKTAGVLMVTLGAFGLLNYALAPPEKLPWMHDEAAALAEARRRKAPVLVDFWAQWCVPCKEMEATILTRPEVRRELQRFVLFKVDVTHDTERDQALQKKYRAPELPQLVLLSPEGKELARSSGKITSVEAMLELLRKAR